MVCYRCSNEISRQLHENHPRKATIDHVKPRALGGSNSTSNWAPCCYECNQKYRPPAQQCSKRTMIKMILAEDHFQVVAMLKRYKNHLNLSLTDITKIIEK